jgi:hypothetical protein
MILCKRSEGRSLSSGGVAPSDINPLPLAKAVGRSDDPLTPGTAKARLDSGSQTGRGKTL